MEPERDFAIFCCYRDEKGLPGMVVGSAFCDAEIFRGLFAEKRIIWENDGNCISSGGWWRTL